MKSGVIYALAAATLFGASTPFAKLLQATGWTDSTDHAGGFTLSGKRHRLVELAVAAKAVHRFSGWKVRIISDAL